MLENVMLLWLVWKGQKKSSNKDSFNLDFTICEF